MMKTVFFLFGAALLLLTALPGCKKADDGPTDYSKDEKIMDPRDGQYYKIVKIGTQVWMQQNMNYATGNSWYYNNDPKYATTYGRLYDWETAQKVCPPGWHLPSEEEWDELFINLRGRSGAGGKMKYIHLWKKPNKNASNSSGFTALPSGMWDWATNSFINMTERTYFWTSTPHPPDEYPSFQILFYDKGEVNLSHYHRETGVPCRCIQNTKTTAR